MAKHTEPPVFFIDPDGVIVVPNADKIVAKAQKIGEALTENARKHGGQIRTENVLEDARNPHHPMHEHIEWSDAKAAHQFRLEQVRTIIRIVRTENADKEPMRAFVNVHANDGQSYRSLSTVLASQSLMDRVMEQAVRDLEAWQSRYKELKDLVDSALVELRKRRSKTTPKDDDGKRPRA